MNHDLHDPEEGSRRPTARDWRQWLLPAIPLLVAAVGLVLAIRSNGMAWDEGFYYPAYVDAWDWTKGLMASPGAALSPNGIEAGWSHVNELPPVTRWIGMAGVAMGGEHAPLVGMRAPFALLFLATVAMIWLAGNAISPRFGHVPALAYLIHPHAFGYGTFATSETPFALITAAVVLVCFHWRLGGWGRRLLLVLLVGLALATKVNGLILGVAVCAWLVGRNLLAGTEQRAWRDDLATMALVVVASPVVALAIWPWMWHDTAARLAEYWAFITQERLYGVWYLGEKWVRPPGNGQPVPWHYPPVMMVVCSPLIFLAAVAAGAARGVRNAVVGRCLPGERALLLFLLVAGPISAVMLPGTGKYDNLRLFLPALVPMALLAVRALDWLGEPARGHRLLPVGIVVVAMASLLPAMAQGIRYYNPPARWLGQTGDGFAFEVSLWGETLTPRVFEEIEALHPSPEGPIRIRTMALQDHVLEIQQGWGTISPRFEFGGDPPYDYHLAHNRRGFWGQAMFWIWWNREPLMSWGEGPGGEPLFLLYDGRPPGQ